MASDNREDDISRRYALECMVWVGTAVLWTVSGGIETQIAVEAETIFDVSPGGLYYANLVVTGVPVVPPTKQAPPNS